MTATENSLDLNRDHPTTKNSVVVTVEIIELYLMVLYLDLSKSRFSFGSNLFTNSKKKRY